MAQQKIKLNARKAGSTAQQVLDALTPLNGVAAPAVNAKFIGQTYIDTATPAVYKAVKVGDATPANDWLRIDAYDASNS